MNHASVPEIGGAWTPLYRVGAWGALAVLAFMPVQMVVFLVWPLPDTVPGWFARFQENPLVGLLSMDLLLAVDYILLGLVFLALYVALRRASQSLMAVALTLELVAVAVYFASTVAFEMLSLSRQYAAAPTDVERSALLAAGHAMLARWEGTAFSASYVLGAVALLVVSVVMLRSGHFGRVAAYAGILAGGAGLVPPTAGAIGVGLSLVSLAPLAVWLALTARGLFRVAHAERRISQGQEGR